MKNKNYWKISTFVLMLLLLFQTFGKNISFAPTNKKTTTPKTPSNTVVRDGAKEMYTYPSNVFWLAKGETAVTADDLYEKKYFTLTLERFPVGVTTFPEKTYKIPVSNVDYISDPKISHDEQYGCVTAGASGYSGYYIFSLPDGKKIADGPQYSQCVEWINDHQVIIVENIYNTYDITYFVFDARDSSENQLSSFSNQQER